MVDFAVLGSVLILRCWVCWFVRVCGCVCVYQRKKMMTERRCLSWFCRWRREGKKGAKCKTLVCKATVTMHICTVTIALLYICTILQTLMWVFFWLKCVKLTTFCILHNFATSKVVALTFPPQFVLGHVGCDKNNFIGCNF